MGRQCQGLQPPHRNEEVVVPSDPPPSADPQDDRPQQQRDLDEVREHLAATSEILTAMGASASDPKAVLSAVVESARRLCQADAAQIYLLEQGAFRVVVATGVSDDYRDYMTRNPILPDRATLAGRVTLDRRAQQIADVLADPEFGRPDIQRLGGFRTTLGVPMLVDDEVVGVVSLWRSEVDPFSERAIDLVTTFAAQAAIAIRNVDLVRALQSRTAELADKVEQLEALREIGHAVSSSLDLDEVLTKIVTHSVQLTDTDGGSLLEYDDATRAFRILAAYGTSNELLESLKLTRITLDGTLVGRACKEGQPRSVPDLERTTLDPHLQRIRDAGWRSVLAVPMLHEGLIVGALVVRRRTTGGFPPDTAELLQTFATQSALAIVNARLFRELERKTGELQVASRHKSEFLASMSHELRTPLNAVIGFSEVLLQRMFGELNERQDDYLRDILGSGRHLLELLNDILDLSKVEAGRMELDPSTFSVRGALDYSLAMVRERAATHAVTLDIDVDPAVGDIETDELRFKQVVLNLLSNAVKFSADGGRVSVRAAVEGAELCVTVTDNGIGIAPADQERIFESFQQAGRLRGQNEGTGLGLTLCRRIVELFGGRMWLDSEVGAGSTFGFSVPVGQTAVGAAQAPEETGAGPLVVVVEDDRRSLELISLYLDGAGVQTVAARDGAEGLAAVRRHHPAAVVLDIRLPGMDGWRVLEALKADPTTAAAPVVVVTMLDERPQALALGASEYLVKPVGRDDVLGALRRVGALPSDLIDKDPVMRETP
jgi:signal transduction histidine kinase/ActR/RegA family two-component response regulator